MMPFAGEEGGITLGTAGEKQRKAAAQDVARSHRRAGRGDHAMAHMDAHDQHGLQDVRRMARHAGHVQRAQVMLLAAGITAFGIVAVAAAMMTTLL